MRMRLSNSHRCSADDRDGKELAPPFRNPFVHKLQFTPLDKAKIALMTMTLLPIRLFLAAFMMLLAWPFAFVATIGCCEDEAGHQCTFRKVIELILKAIMRALWFTSGFHWVTVKGRQALPTEAPILTVAPHSSYFDAIPVTMTMASVVMKTESRHIPIWGTLIRFILPVFVSRSDENSRRKTVEEIKRRAHSGGAWPQIMIFPEGTCTNRSCLITFKPGAFIPAVPVQPVILHYPNRMDTITWTWQGPGVLQVLWLTLCQLQNNVTIEFLPVYTPSEEEKNNPALYANNVRRVMARALGVPVTDYSFEDCQLATREGLLPLPEDTVLLEFAKLVRTLGLKPRKEESCLQEHVTKARKLRAERLSLEDLSQYLKLPVSDALRELFCLFSESECGRMDIREYVIALSVVCRQSETLKTIQLAFEMFEAEEDGAIVEEDLACILKTALGVPELSVTELFRAIDVNDKGKITFDDFRRLVQQCPDFASQYLYTQHVSFQSTFRRSPVANGLCVDFCPRDVHSARNLKKAD